jgi:hypothetical protein
MSRVTIRRGTLTMRRLTGMGGVASLALAVLAVAAALTLGIEIRARRKVVATLRGGE